MNDNEQISILIEGFGEIKRFTEYSYVDNYLSPCNTFTFTIAGNEIDPLFIQKLIAGTKVQLLIDGNTQSTGYITAQHIRGSICHRPQFYLLRRRQARHCRRGY